MKTLASGYTVAPALCLDLDGTVRRSKSGKQFHEGLDDIELMPGIERIISKYRQMGWLILGISNQAGVAWGYKTPELVHEEMLYTLSLFRENPFHLVKQCYHDGKGHVEPFNYRSLCRKPGIGMLALMECEAFTSGHVIDWDTSIFVGDRPEDEECAKNAGVKFHHIDEFLVMPHEFVVEAI